MLKSITMSLAVVSLFACGNSSRPISPDKRVPIKPNHIIKTIEDLPKGWIDIRLKDSSFILAMPYATQDNFLKEAIYPCAKCLLRADAAQALLKAQTTAQKKGYTIVLLDCYRPLRYQKKMFDITPDTKYVADPKRGSKHNKGVAVDISLADTMGHLLDMGTDFDDFSEKARYDCQNVSAEAKKNRKILREIMLTNDFTPYNNEWWHFNYKETDYPNADIIWNCDE